jgi:hypothetical protein
MPRVGRALHRRAPFMRIDSQRTTKEGDNVRRPAFQFYPADWRKDSALQSCSGAARGLWIELICLMHECDPYGHLEINGKPPTDAQVARMVGFSVAEYRKALAELESAGVFSRLDGGAIFCRRMVADERIRNARAEGGKSGGEFGERGREHGIKGGRPAENKPPLEPPFDDVARGENKPPLEPPPSSSSSFASSTAEKQKQTQIQNPRSKPFAADGKNPPSPAPELTPGLRDAARQVWHAYAEAYAERYGEQPVRNAKVNRNVLDLCRRLPTSEAPAVAAFFVRNNSRFYVAKGHALGLLLADAEKLRTEWATGRSITETEARLVDRTQATGNTFSRLIEERRNGTEG